MQKGTAMEQLADRISEKIHTLSAAQLAEVERFVESLQAWQANAGMTSTMMLASEPAFHKIWNNPEDEAYDSL
jgi:hypothetical protein